MVIVENRSKKVIRTSALLAFLLGVLLAWSPFGRVLDDLAYDFNFLWSGESAVSSEVVIVAIDESSFQELNQPWPWPRDIHAKLLESLFKAGAKVVVLDLILADITERDQALVDVLNQYGPVVLATDDEHTINERFSRVISVQPRPEFKTKNVLLGSATLPVDSDGFVRRFGQGGVRGEASLAAAALSAIDKISQHDLSITARINFSNTIPQVSYYQALEADQYLPDQVLRDKIVLVGLVTGSDVLDQTASRDSYPIPYSRWGAGLMNGVEIHAQATQSLINQDEIIPLSSAAILSVLLLLAALTYWVVFNISPLKSSAPILLGGGLLVVFCIWVFHSRHIYIAWPTLLLPSLAIAIVSPLAHYFVAWRERNFIHKAFSSYLAEPVVKQLMEDPSLLQAGGSLKQGSVLFFDLQGFTSLSEKMEPEPLIDLLNLCLGDLAEIVIEQGGLVDKFIGDAIMAVWGVPFADDHHAERACRTALKMQQWLTQARNDGRVPDLYARIGIASGEFVAGNVGGQRKFDYTVIGDTVNLAARLESENRHHGTSILLSESTLALLDNQFTTREVARVTVKGREQAVTIYELLEANA